MPDTKLVTQQYTSSEFVESCGAVLFDLTSPNDIKVCLGNIVGTELLVLPKGRRNIGETRKDAALREVYEETGYECALFPVTMPTRACAPDAPANVRDRPRVHDSITEPFMYTFRELRANNGVKVIWWFIARTLTGEQSGPGEEQFNSQLVPIEEAVARLSFESDKDVLSMAIQLVQDTLARSV